MDDGFQVDPLDVGVRAGSGGAADHGFDTSGLEQGCVHPRGVANVRGLPVSLVASILNLLTGYRTLPIEDFKS